MPLRRLKTTKHLFFGDFPFISLIYCLFNGLFFKNYLCSPLPLAEILFSEPPTLPFVQNKKGGVALHLRFLWTSFGSLRIDTETLMSDRPCNLCPIAIIKCRKSQTKRCAALNFSNKYQITIMEIL